MDPFPLSGARTAEFLLSEANGERSRALFSVPANTDTMKAGTILAADGTPAAVPEEAVAILYATVFESTAIQKATAVAKDAEVHGEFLQWPEGTDDADKTAYAVQLATVGIVIRWTERPTGLEHDADLADDAPPPEAP